MFQKIVALLLLLNENVKECKDHVHIILKGNERLPFT